MADLSRSDLLDARAVAFYTGAADARNSRPRRDVAGYRLGDVYLRGYVSVAAPTERKRNL